MLLSLCVWKQSVPDYYVLPTDVSQESPNIMWLKFSHVTNCYCHLSKLVQISLEMEPFTRSHVSNELMKLPVSFSAGLSPVPSLPSHKPFFRIPSCVCSILLNSFTAGTWVYDLNTLRYSKQWNCCSNTSQKHIIVSA